MLSCTPTESVIDLSGEWKVKIDSVQYKIMLPGSLAENKVGFQPKDSVTNILTETYSYQEQRGMKKILKFRLHGKITQVGVV